ncbi:MAG: hypothetical protein AB1416_03250 [Actinomycetota bacterium]
MDIRDAFTHPMRVFELDEGLIMLIGAGAIGEPLEIGAVQSPTGPVIVHAMKAREKFLR